MTSIYDVLKASKGIHVDDTFAELWGRKLSNAYTVDTYSGTLPTTLQTVEGYLESYKIYGNTVQDGTPTPENPIVPSGCGVRTENLINIVQPVNMSHAGYIYRGEFFFSGESLTINSTFTSSIAIVDKNNTEILNREISGNTPYTVQTPNGVKSLRIYAMSAVTGYIMFSSGSTSLPYEPYGYKLPLTVNGVEHPIYLGESQTTRRIKKLVLTGGEVSTVDASSKQALIPLPYRCLGVAPLCSHYIGKITSAWSTIGNGEIAVLQQGSATARICDTTYATTASNYNNFLAQQYAAGTPVTVWYVLAEPETAVVNEPLMKIGDYADTVSMEQAGVSIPTASGSTVIDYDGTPKPDKVELTYRKPKGQ